MNTQYIDTSMIDNALLISHYEKLRDKLYTMIYYLNKSINALDGVDGTLVQNYNIDDTRVSDINIKTVYENLKDRVSYLKSTVIPSINSKINSLK